MTRADQLKTVLLEASNQLLNVSQSICLDLEHPNVWLAELDRIRRTVYEATTELEHLKQQGEIYAAILTSQLGPITPI